MRANKLEMVLSRDCSLHHDLVHIQGTQGSSFFMRVSCFGKSLCVYARAPRLNTRHPRQLIFKIKVELLLGVPVRVLTFIPHFLNEVSCGMCVCVADDGPQVKKLSIEDPQAVAQAAIAKFVEKYVSLHVCVLGVCVCVCVCVC